MVVLPEGGIVTYLGMSHFPRALHLSGELL